MGPLNAEWIPAYAPGKVAFGRIGFTALSATAVYVLDTGRNFWQVSGPFPNPNPVPIDSNVQAAQVISGNTVLVLGTDGKLWYTPSPYGSVPNPKRRQVDQEVLEFIGIDFEWAGGDTTVYVLDWNHDLWYVPNPFGYPDPKRAPILANVRSFQVYGDPGSGRAYVFVRDNNGHLWYVPQPFPSAPVLVASNVASFSILDENNVFVMVQEGGQVFACTLVYTPAPFAVPNPGQNALISDLVPPWGKPSFQVLDAKTVIAYDNTGQLSLYPNIPGGDSSVIERAPGMVGFFAVDPQRGVFTTEIQGDGPLAQLYFAPAPFGQDLRQSGGDDLFPANWAQIDADVRDFLPIYDDIVLVLGFDSKLWYTSAPFQYPNINRQLIAENVTSFLQLTSWP